MKGHINFARFESSVRLQRMLNFLLDGKKHSTLEIIHGADVCAVNSCAAELRENGFTVRCLQTKPALYWLADPKAAAKLRDRLLERRPVKQAA